MTAALYVMLAYLDWRRCPAERGRGTRRRSIRDCCSALLMIAAELALLTAVALFFSTFSSSALLSVVFTVGIFVAGLFSADLRQIRRRRRRQSPSSLRSWPRIGWLVPAFSAFDIKAQVVHGLPLPPGFVLVHAWLRRAVHRRPACWPRSRRSRGGSSSDGPASSALAGAAAAALAVIGAGRGDPAARASATRRCRRRPSGSCTCGREARPTAYSCRSMRWRLTSTGSAPSSTTDATASRARTQAASNCSSRLLDLTTTLDPHFNIAYRFGAIFLVHEPPNGPGRADQAIALLEKGSRRNPTRWQYAHDIGFIHYWYTGDYRRGRALV